MARLLRWQDDHRLLPMLLVFSLMLLGLCVVIAWPRGGASAERSGPGLRAAYDRATFGASQPELAALGFDGTRAGVRRLSGLGVQEYFMPRTSREFDQLDPAVQDCFEAPDRCNVLIFPMGEGGAGGGFFAAHAAPQEAGRIVLLLRSGRLTYKEMDGA
jgi:hypothetical protein